MAEQDRFARAVQTVARGLGRISRERARADEVTPQQAETLQLISERGAVSTSTLANAARHRSVDGEPQPGRPPGRGPRHAQEGERRRSPDRRAPHAEGQARGRRGRGELGAGALERARQDQPRRSPEGARRARRARQGDRRARRTAPRASAESAFSGRDSRTCASRDRAPPRNGATRAVRSGAADAHAPPRVAANGDATTTSFTKPPPDRT